MASRRPPGQGGQAGGQGGSRKRKIKETDEEETQRVRRSEPRNGRLSRWKGSPTLSNAASAVKHAFCFPSPSHLSFTSGMRHPYRTERKLCFFLPQGVCHIPTLGDYIPGNTKKTARQLEDRVLFAGAEGQTCLDGSSAPRSLIN